MDLGVDMHHVTRRVHDASQNKTYREECPRKLPVSNILWSSQSSRNIVIQGRPSALSITVIVAVVISRCRCRSPREGKHVIGRPVEISMLRLSIQKILRVKLQWGSP